MASSRYSRYPSDPTPTAGDGSNTSRALARAAARDKNTSNFGFSVVKKFIEKRTMLRPGSAADRTVLALPEEIKKKLTPPAPGKPSNFTSALQRKLFPRAGSAEKAPKALTEVRPNTRTLAMVLRSERELLAQSKEYEDEISELKLLAEEKNRQVEKLKDLCLKQREEIKALKDAILFPDVMNSQLHDLLEKQGSELKHARQIIPNLQKQVTSLSGQLRCIADDLAEVKADKYATRTCFDGHINSPETPKFDQEAPNSLEYSSGGPTVYGSPDDMFLKDFNPCLTPFFSKTENKEYDEMSGYDSLNRDVSFQNSAELSQESFSGSLGRKLSKSSENCKAICPRLQHC
ncbi:uncharacterized protein M6B38_345010 [Iris pallida]|uniref:Uncharacterized protein n=2 Tax=Iris pallida TaxID=29817 RepID=A0AAX6GUN8_IRIPA|nr:uncharacterized protein M6B38_345010 [Iris pallida]